MRRVQKQWAILVIDLIAITFGYHLAGFVRFGWILPDSSNSFYRSLFLAVLLLYNVVYGCVNHDQNFRKRGYLDELIEVFRVYMYLAFVLLAVLYLFQKSSIMSRWFYFAFFSFSVIISLLLRIYFKIWLQTCYRKSEASEKVLIVTTEGWAENVVKKFRMESVGSAYITGVAIIDQDRQGSQVCHIPVIASEENLFNVAAKEVVDTVLLCIPSDYSTNIEEVILQFQNMGITVELSIQLLPITIKEKAVTNYAGFHVITFSTKIFRQELLFAKRVIDIIGSLIGICITIVVGLFVVPAIFIESPGHVIFTQTRIGKNGRRFKIYKFRSMYPDAEQRKKDLMDQNQMSGQMFKMDHDPRITKVGHFIRKTSIDELPQFFNVLIGNMSLVGTRPPTEDEFLHYETRHKRRLALKPGITGLWQVSGRSDITDFEEVVKLDLQYIDQWSLMEDFRILLKTVKIVLMRDGAR